MRQILLLPNIHFGKSYTNPYQNLRFHPNIRNIPSFFSLQYFYIYFTLYEKTQSRRQSPSLCFLYSFNKYTSFSLVTPLYQQLHNFTIFFMKFQKNLVHGLISLIFSNCWLMDASSQVFRIGVVPNSVSTKQNSKVLDPCVSAQVQFPDTISWYRSDSGFRPMRFSIGIVHR